MREREILTLFEVVCDITTTVREVVFIFFTCLFMKKKFSVLFLVITLLLQFSPVKSTLVSSIVINEIGAYESTGFEWIEIYNRGEEPVDLTGLKFWEAGVNHSLEVKQGTHVLGPREFAVIVQDDVKFKQKYGAVTSTILDSSWGALNESGEEIGFKDAAGNFLEQLTYVGAGDFSLERVDAVLDDSTVNNWKEHMSGNTVGAVNSVAVVPVVPVGGSPPEESEPVEEKEDPLLLDEEIPVEQDMPDEETSQEESPPPEDNQENTTTTVSHEPIKIVINEFLPDPNEGEKEWIELYNNSSVSVDLTGWTLEDGAGKIVAPTSTIEAHGFFVVELTSSKLNNGGDVVILKNAEGAVVDEVRYGNGEQRSEPAPPQKGNTLARSSESIDTDRDLENFRETTTVTKGEKNSITLPVVLPVTTQNNSSSGSGGTGNSSSSERASPQFISPGSLVINEVYPNPPGTDTEDEYIEFLNISNSLIDLKGYKVVDASGTSFALTQKIEAQGFVTVYRKITHISLNNTGTEVVKVVGSSGDVVAEFAYEGSREGESINRIESGQTKWSVVRTPNAKNSIQEKIIDDEDITEDAKEILEKKNLEKTATKKEQEKKVEYKREIGQYLQISEILPAPEKGGEEFIEIFNLASTTVDISFFQVDDEDGGSRPYVFPGGTFIEGHQFFLVPKKVSHLSFNNTEDSARILFPDGDVIDEVQYDDALPGFSFARDINGEWQWTSKVTFGQENKIVFAKTETSKKIKGVIVTSLEKIGEFEKGDKVQIKGIVVVPPQVFSSQYFYIFDKHAIQVYMSKKDFPDLQVGDEVQVIGELSESQGQLRVKVKEKKNIVKVGTKEIPVEEVGIAEIDEALQGMVVAATGEVTEKKSNYLYIDDGTAEVEVALKKNAGIKMQDIQLGDTVSVTGVVLTSKSGYQILPRTSADVIKKRSASSTIIQADEGKKDANKTAIVATTGGVGSLILGFLAKIHGNKILNFTKRARSLVITVIRKKKDLG